MLSRKQRLPRQNLSNRRFRVHRTPYFTFKRAPNNGSLHRISVVIGSAVVKNASRRNFLRRQIKSILLAAPGEPMDFVVIAGSAINTIKKADLKKELSKFL